LIGHLIGHLIGSSGRFRRHPLVCNRSGTSGARRALAPVVPAVIDDHHLVGRNSVNDVFLVKH
jgi:hypothetical protein